MEPKIKTEVYSLLGGINTKASKYFTGPTEMLDIQNMNFNRPNSLTSRYGLTNYCAVGGTPVGLLASLITGLFEYSELTGFSMMVVAGDNRIDGYGLFGVTQVSTNTNTLTYGFLGPPWMDMKAFVNHLFYCNGQIFKKYSSLYQEELFSLPPGNTLQNLGVTIYAASQQLTGVIGFAYGYLNDRGYLGPAINALYISMTTGQGARIGGITTPSGYGITAIAIYSTNPNQSQFFPSPTAFLSVGATFFYTTDFYLPYSYAIVPPGTFAYLPDGINTINYGQLYTPGVSLAIPPSFNGNILQAGLTLTVGVTTALGIQTFGIQNTGIFGFAAAYLNTTGGLGSLTPYVTLSMYQLAAAAFSVAATLPAGVTALVLFATRPGGTSLFNIQNYGSSLTAIPNTGGALTYIVGGAVSFLAAGGPVPPNGNGAVNTDVLMPDINNNLDLGLQPAPQALFFTLTPKYMQIFQNAMFTAGFTATKSNVYFSDPGEPESVQPTSFFEVRTDDGDRITGMKAYGARMVISKRKSMHLLTGSSAQNYYLREISAEYGCLSHRAMAVFEDTLLFLDEKGIAIFDGQSCKIISNRIESVFKTMNVGRALDTAIAVHNRPENQVIFAFPSTGGNYGGGWGLIGYNDTVVVYDYLVNAFTVYKNIYPSCFAMGKGSFQSDTLFAAIYGSESPITGGGATLPAFVQYFGASLFTDLFAFGGVLGLSGFPGGPSQVVTGISCSWTSPYVNPLGHSTEAQFRRLFSDFDAVGSTVLCNIRFFQDFNYVPPNPGLSLAPSLSLLINLNQFQVRVDMGIPAKAMAVQWQAANLTGPLAFNGYSIDARFQRNV